MLLGPLSVIEQHIQKKRGCKYCPSLVMSEECSSTVSKEQNCLSGIYMRGSDIQE